MWTVTVFCWRECKVRVLKSSPKINIECVDNLEYMRSLSKSSMHLIVTSPPYNIGKEYEKRTSLDLYVEEQSAAIAEAVRLLSETGSICWQVGNHIDNNCLLPQQYDFTVTAFTSCWC